MDCQWGDNIILVISIDLYSDEEFDTMMPHLGAADVVVVIVAATLGTLDALGAVALLTRRSAEVGLIECETTWLWLAGFRR